MEGDMYRIAGIEFDHVVQILRSSAATRGSVCRVMWMFSVTFSSSFNFIAPTKKKKNPWLRLELQILVRWNLTPVGERAAGARMCAVLQTDLLYQLKRSQLTPSSW